MYTIDASVHISALNKAEPESGESRAFLEQIRKQSISIFSPTLLIVEIATAIAGIFDDPIRGIALAQAIRLLPNQMFITLDDSLAIEAGRIGAQHRLRGADAIYAAVARNSNCILVTLDKQQLVRLAGILDVKKPGEVGAAG